MWNEKTIDRLSIASAWTGFIAGAEVFGAEYPQACGLFLAEDLRVAELAALPDKYAEALPLILSAVGRAVDYREFDDGEMVPAGLDIKVDPNGATIGFGSGRSRIEMKFGLWGARIEVGLQYDPTSLDDADGAMYSVQIRYDAAYRAAFAR